MLHAALTPLCCALLSGLGAALAFRGFGPWLAWFAFVPLLFVLQRPGRLWPKLAAAFLFGLVFYGLSLYWVAYVSVFGAVILCIVLSCFLLVFACLCHLAAGIDARLLFVCAPVFWCALEKTQELSVTAFPWLKLAYAVADLSALCQIAEFTGAAGLSFVVMLVNSALLALVLGFPRKSGNRGFLLSFSCAALLALSLLRLAGAARLENFDTGIAAAKERGFLRIAGVQGNVMPALYGGATMEDVEKSLRLFRRMTEELCSGPQSASGLDLVVWPETAVPADFRYWLVYFQAVHNLSERFRVPFLIGSADADADESGRRRHTNTAFLYSAARGGVTGRYDKMRLVPFGEFLPFSRLLGWMRRFVFIPPDLSPGRGSAVLEIAGSARFCALICFEDMFPGLSRAATLAGAGFLLNITHDGWFRASRAAVQHRDGARFRAIENRRALLRVTLTGVSCLIDPAGRIVAQIEEDGRIVCARGAKVFNLDRRWLSADTGFYTRHGDLCGRISLFFAILFAIAAAIRKGRGRA